MDLNSLYKEIVSEIEETMSSLDIFSQSILLFADENTKMLEILYEKLTKNETVESIDIDPNNKIFTWSKNPEVAIVLISEDFQQTNYSYSQGYAIKIRDFIAKSNQYSVLFIGTYKMMSIDSLSTVAAPLSENILSRREILNRKIKRIADNNSNNYVPFFIELLEKMDDFYLYTNFEKIFTFYKILESSDSENNIAQNLFLLGLIPDDILSFEENLALNNYQYLAFNQEFTNKLSDVLAKGESAYYLLQKYCNQPTALEIDRWLRNRGVRDLQRAIDNWPIEYFLSKIIQKFETKKEKSDIEITKVSFEEGQHLSKLSIFNKISQEVFSINENEIHLNIHTSKPLRGTEVLEYTINDSVKPKLISIIPGKKIFLLVIPDDNSVKLQEGLNFIHVDYKPTKKSHPKSSIIFYFYLNREGREWEIFEINKELQKNRFVMHQEDSNEVILQVHGEMPDGLVVNEISNLDSIGREQLFVDINYNKNQIIIPFDILPYEGIFEINTDDKHSSIIEYLIVQEHQDAQKIFNHVFDILYLSQFEGDFSSIKLNTNFSYNLKANDSNDFGAPLLSYPFRGRDKISIENTLNRANYKLNLSETLLELEKWIVVDCKGDPFPTRLQILREETNISFTKSDLIDLNKSWVQSIIFKLQELKEYKQFSELRTDLFQNLEETISIVDRPISTLNLIKMEGKILAYCDAYYHLLKRCESFSDDDSTNRAINSLLLFIDGLFIQNGSDIDYIIIKPPTHPIVLLNLLAKQELIHSIFDHEKKINKNTIGDLFHLKESILPYLLSMENQERDTVPEKTYMKLSSNFEGWVPYILVSERRYGILQKNDSEIENVITDVINFSILDKDIDTTEVMKKYIEEYILSHPFIKNEKSNISITYLNPSTGEPLLNALRKIKSSTKFKEYDLFFNVFLISRDEISSQELGSSFIEYFAQINPGEKDVDLMHSMSYMISDLSVKNKSEFKNFDKAIQTIPFSNISFISDLFHDSEEVDLLNFDDFSASLKGIIGYYDTKFDKKNQRFVRGVFLSPETESIKVANALIKIEILYEDIFRKMGQISASIVNDSKINLQPILSLSLDRKMVAIIREILSKTDWGCFLDSKFGIELFDYLSEKGLSKYLLEYTSSVSNLTRHRGIIIASENCDHLKRILRSQLKLLFNVNISDKFLEGKFVSAVNYLAGEWGLTALRDLYPLNNTKIAELINYLIFCQEENLTKILKMDENNKCILVKIITPLDKIIKRWIKDEKQEYKNITEDLLEITLEFEPDEDNIIISYNPILCKIGHHSSSASVIKSSKIEIKSVIDLMKKRFIYSKNTFRELELIEYLEKSVLRFFRYNLPERLDQVKSFLELVSSKIFNGEYKFRAGRVNEEMGSKGKIVLFDPDVQERVYEEENIEISIFNRTSIQNLMPSEQLESEEDLEETEKTKIIETAIALSSEEVETEVIAEEDYLDVEPTLVPEIIIGTGAWKDTNKWITIGKCDQKSLSINLESPQRILVLGEEKSGKSNTICTIIESFHNLPVGLNSVRDPYITSIFQYSHINDMKYNGLVEENTIEKEVNELKELYDKQTDNISKIKLFVPAKNINAYNLKYKKNSSIEIYPLFFNPSDLLIDEWRILLYIVSEDEEYREEIRNILRKLSNEEKLNLINLKSVIKRSKSLNEAVKNETIKQLDAFSKYLSKNEDFVRFLEPNDVILLNIQNNIEANFAMSIYLIYSCIFSRKSDCKKAIIFDTINRYIDSVSSNEFERLFEELIDRETNLIVSSEAIEDICYDIIDNCSAILIHRSKDSRILEIIHKTYPQLKAKKTDFTYLNNQEARILTKEVNDYELLIKLKKVKIRPRVTRK